jgi:plastocyanin
MLTRSRRAGSTVLGLIPVLAAAALLAAACGGDDNTSATTTATTQPSLAALPTRTPAPPATATTVATAATTAPAGPQTLDITQNNFFFQPKEFTVKAGQQVTFNIQNNGTTTHDMRVAGADNEFNTADDAVSKSQAIAAGETSTLEWTAPAKAGTYDFHCDFHRTQMTGTITVQ